MSRRFPGRAAWTALSLILACGCAATLHTVSVDEELARKDSRIVRGRLSIDGYYDYHGLYHRTPGSIRSAGDRTLELRRETGHMRFETVRLSADSVRTLVVLESHNRPLGITLLVVGGLALLIYLDARP